MKKYLKSIAAFLILLLCIIAFVYVYSSENENADVIDDEQTDMVLPDIYFDTEPGFYEKTVELIYAFIEDYEKYCV